MSISAIVISYNEGIHLEGCLKSLQNFDEILVFDMGSTDRSLEIARKYASKVTSIEHNIVVERVWESVISQAANDWILLLDPDEVFPAGMFPELVHLVRNHPEVGLIAIPWKFYFLGKPLTCTIWGRKLYKSRIFHRERTQISGLLFEGIDLKPGFTKYTFPNETPYIMEHYWIDSIPQLFSKHWRHIKGNGEARYKKGERFSLRKLLAESAGSLYKNFFEYNGLRGGWPGVFLSFFHAWFTFMCNLSLGVYQLIGSGGKRG